MQCQEENDRDLAVVFGTVRFEQNMGKIRPAANPTSAANAGQASDSARLRVLQLRRDLRLLGAVESAGEWWAAWISRGRKVIDLVQRADIEDQLMSIRPRQIRAA